MRKNNDGYVIIYVIFVILFLCIVAIGTCSSALSNLQSQNEAVVQMQEKYAAEGEIEKQIATVCASVRNITGFNDTIEIEESDNPHEYVRLAAVAQIENNINIASLDIVQNLEWVSGRDILTISAEVKSGGVSAIVQLLITVAINTSEIVDQDTQTDESDEDDTTKVYNASYEITNVTSQYLSYAIESKGGDAA